MNFNLFNFRFWNFYCFFISCIMVELDFSSGTSRYLSWIKTSPFSICVWNLSTSILGVIRFFDAVEYYNKHLADGTISMTSLINLWMAFFSKSPGTFSLPVFSNLYGYLSEKYISALCRFSINLNVDPRGEPTEKDLDGQDIVNKAVKMEASYVGIQQLVN